MKLFSKKRHVSNTLAATITIVALTLFCQAPSQASDCPTQNCTGSDGCTGCTIPKLIDRLNNEAVLTNFHDSGGYDGGCRICDKEKNSEGKCVSKHIWMRVGYRNCEMWRWGLNPATARTEWYKVSTTQCEVKRGEVLPSPCI